MNIHELPFSRLAHPCHHLTVVLTDTYSHWPRSVLHTHALPSPLTLCVWRAVPFTLIKTTNAPIPPTLLAHAPLPSALITEPSISLIGVISSSERPSSSPVCSHLWEVCRRDRGHRLWRADVHRVPQCRYKEVRKRTRGTERPHLFSFFQHVHCNMY